MRAALVVLLVLLALLPVAAGCGEGEAEPRPAELTGLIVSVEGEGSDVRAFTLEVGLEDFEIRIADDVDYGFDLSHLREHEQQALPVRCNLEERDGELFALTIEDV